MLPPVLRAVFFLLVSISCACAQVDVRISEFLPVNTTGLKDEDATVQPWIELWNASTTTKAMLTSWKLVHGASQWTFPSTMEIPPGEYLVVFADSKNRTVLTAPLHTNFTLDAAGGGPLSLVNNVGTTVSTFTTYPPLAANVSYGRDGAQITQIGRYTNPTPGDANNYSGSGVSGKVLISLSSRAFTGTLSVTLTQETPVAGAVIRYTTNGSVPMSVPPSAATTFTIPIPVSATTLLRARVFEPGKLPGETAGAGYLLLNGTTSGFNTAAPIVVVSTFGVAVPDAGHQPAFMWVWEPGADLRARFMDAGGPVVPTLATRCAVDRRGSSTLGNAKTNFNLEARRGRDDVDKDVSLLGMPAGSDWVFHAPFIFDPSLIHNPFVYALSNSIGRQAMRTRMAEVFVETNGGALDAPGGNTNDYFGVYNVMEKIRRGPDRVDVQKLDPYDNDVVRKTGGYIFKVDRQDTGDLGFTAGGQALAYYYPKEVQIKSPPRDPQEQYLTSYINSYKAALDSVNYKDPAIGYAAWLDVAEAVDHHLLNVWAFNVDALRLSGYLHKERGGKLLFGPVWDFDRALSSTDGRDSNPATWRSQTADLGTDFFNYPWWGRMFTDANFYQRYIDRWVELRRGAFSPTSVNALIDTLNAQLTAEGVARDLSRWHNAKRSWSRPFTPFNTIAASQAAEVQRLKDYLQQRANFFDSQWVKPVAFSSSDGNITPGLSLTMTAAAGSTIRYTLDGSDPRPSGGGAAGGSVLTYSAPITIDATTRVKARAYNASWTALTGSNNPPLVSKWSGLTDARFSTDTPAAAANLAVTEVNYHPVDPTVAELAINPVFAASDFEFIELKNIGATAIDLGGVELTLGVTFTFTNDVALTLQPGQFAVIAANPAAFAARYPGVANVVGPFTGDLANNGEEIVIKSADATTIADFTYDDAWYSATDGGGKTLVIYNPTASSAAFSTAANWRASAATGGSPGADEPNLTPLVNAGPDRTGYLPSITLTGATDDDTLPTKPLTMTWSQLTGPGTASFAPADASATTVSFDLPGVYNLRLTASDGALSAFDDTTVRMRDTPGAWLLRHPGIGTLNDDADGDGRTNWFEWTLTLDPSSGTGSDGSVTGIESGHLTLTYTRQKDSPFVSYIVQVTSDLTAWADPLPGEVSETISADDGVTQTVKATDNAPAGPSRFIRLKVTPLP